jgi:hypothetical protein
MRSSIVFGMMAIYINVHDAAYGLTGLADGVLFPAVIGDGRSPRCCGGLPFRGESQL